MQIRLHHLDSVVKPRNDKGAGSEKNDCDRGASPQVTHVLETLSLRASVATRGNPVYFMLRAAHSYVSSADLPCAGDIYVLRNTINWIASLHSQ